MHALLEARAHVDGADSFTPLCAAAESGRVDVASMLLKAKADLDAQDDDGYTPLANAAENSQTDVVVLLLQAKSHVDNPDARGRTPLFHGLDSVDVARQLLQPRARVDAVDHAGRTPLMVAANQSYCCEDAVPLLLEAKASVHALGKHGRTALHEAVVHGIKQHARVRFNDQDLPDVDEHGHAIPCAAIDARYTNIIALLLAAKSDVDIPDHTGETPLSRASRHEWLPAMQPFSSKPAGPANNNTRP
jgi:ankyrin repeat protein